MATFAILFGLGVPEMIALGIVGVLLFGRKLPEVGKYLGRTITAFRDGIRGVEADIDGSLTAQSSSAPVEPTLPPQRVVVTAPKFEESPAGA